ncbi:hypothetical protein F5X98DRAFT_388104 [Xylaria grammica]|nr:hypothetical protein F5X98DRAFT_388104 [Xylaria grammica]
MAIIPRSLDPYAPVVQPPPGVQSNFVNPPNGNALMNGIVSANLALISIILTVYAYGKIRRRLHLEDCQPLYPFCVCLSTSANIPPEDLVIPAIIAFIIFHVFVYRITATTGYFVHGWNLQYKDLSWHFFNIYITTSMYNVCMIFLKAAILLQWVRIFTPGGRNFFFWLCYIVASLNALFYLATILIDLLYCHPVQYHWNKFIPGGYCGDDDLLSPLSAVINVVLDVTIFLIPQKVIWSLNLPPKKKLGVSLVFFMGFLCIVFASVRLHYAVILLYANDYAYDSSFEILWGSLEMTFALLTFLLPGIPKPFTTLMQHTRSSLERVRQSSWGTWTTWTRVSSTFTSRGERSEANVSYLTNTDEQGLVPVAKASSSKTSSSEQRKLWVPMQGLSTEAGDHEILRTTTFNMSEGISDTNIDYMTVLSQQHPWEPPSTKREAC